MIEEIEAHLHPQAQLRVVSALENEAQDGGVQLIITTHSQNLASKIKIENLLLCHEKSVYPLGSDYTELKKTDYLFLERFLDVTKANLFFAQGVILVEGDAENILVPSIARLIGKDLTDYGVSVVNVGGTSFLRYGNIFKRQKDKGELKIPVAVITDLDIKPDDEAAKKAGATEKKQEKYDGQSVKTFVSPHWTLEYCLALSSDLKEFIFEAIKSAGQEMTEDGYTGKKVADDWNTFSNGLSDTDLAKKIYNLVRSAGNGGKGISKAITAQYMANSIEERLKDQDFVSKAKEDKKINYIIKAIEYATSNINN